MAILLPFMYWKIECTEIMVRMLVVYTTSAASKEAIKKAITQGIIRTNQVIFGSNSRESV